MNLNCNINQLRNFLWIGTILCLAVIASVTVGHAEIHYRPMDPSDDPSKLSSLPAAFEKNMFQLNAPELRSAQLSRRPWSTGPWAAMDGLIASRYADTAYTQLSFLREFKKYISSKPVELFFSRPGRLSDDDLDLLSPAEKYDLLTGDRDVTLTHAIWTELEGMEKAHRLNAWTGICEGSAAASVMMPEPVKAVTLRSPIGKHKIVFHAVDIKALAALLWSGYSFNPPVTGRRCISAAPQMKGDIVIDESCFDSNPATLHLALMNVFNKQKKTIFADWDPGPEVWNAPLYSYELKYFNPDTHRETGDNLIAATVPVEKMKSDHYSDFRTPGTKSLVGVSLKLTYAMGEYADRDVASPATLETRELTYDLELDLSGNILGGEWISGDHPDFLWMVPEGYQPISSGDLLLSPGEKWDGKAVPEHWLGAVQFASVKLQPLYAIVQKLVELSSR